MSLLSHASDLELDQPVMLLAMSGWVDAASVGTDTAERIAGGGEVVAAFEPDALFDYRSSRPTLHFSDGDLTGNEPDFRWQELTREFVDLTRRYNVSKFVTLGAVPAPVPHTRPVRVLCTTSDTELLRDGDEVMPEELVVPGAAVSVLRQGVSDAGLPAIGYWAQVPHYLQGPFHNGVLGLIERVGGQVGVRFPIGELALEATSQLEQIDADLAERDDARQYVERLELMQDERPELVTPFQEVPSADEIGAEVEKFLRSTGDEDSP